MNKTIKTITFKTFSEMKKNNIFDVLGICKTENNTYISFTTTGKHKNMTEVKFHKFLQENEEWFIENFKIGNSEGFKIFNKNYKNILKYKIIKEGDKIKGYKFIVNLNNLIKINN